MPLIGNDGKGGFMFRILVTILIVIISFAKNIPESLAKGISEETAAFTRISPEEWEKVGYRGITKKLIDAAIDDSGNIHIIIDEYYRGQKHVWSYLRYDKNGNKLFEKQIYSGEYICSSHNLLVSRILVNPDMTVLIFYSDVDFYTCWVKLDKEGNIIERNEPKWWRGDAKFQVCSAGQDSFHIVTWPHSFWGELIKQYDPEIGEFYLAINPTLIPELYYSNNFSLKGQLVRLRLYRSVSVPKIIALPDNKIFCLFSFQEYGSCWIMDSDGKEYNAEKIYKDNLDEICFAKVRIDTIVERLAKEVRVPQLGLGLYPDSTIGIGIYWKKNLYLVKYDLNGKIIQKGKGLGKLVKVSEINKDRTLPFITQTRVSGRRGAALDKTILYWGFDDLCNFFLQIY